MKEFLGKYKQAEIDNLNEQDRSKKYNGKIVGKKTLIPAGVKGSTSYFLVDVEVEIGMGKKMIEQFVMKGGDGMFPIAGYHIVFKKKHYLHNGRYICRIHDVEEKDRYYFRSRKISTRERKLEEIRYCNE